MVSRTKISQISQDFKNHLRAKQTSTFVLRQINRRYILTVLILSLFIVACTNTSQSNQSLVNEFPADSKVLKVWWDKGSNLEEDEALQPLVGNWEKQSGKKIKLSFYTNDELPQKTQRAIQAGKLPDIVMISSAQREQIPRLAWEGKLADVSDVIEPVKSLDSKGMLEAVYFYNNVNKNWGYYAVPISQLTIHIFYWRYLLNQVGKSERDIPKDWDGFWEFWKQMQDNPKVNQKSDPKPIIYGLGFPISIESADTYYLFEQVLEAKQWSKASEFLTSGSELNKKNKIYNADLIIKIYFPQTK
ncbi:extracellular solute-binding protein [Nostoc sp. B(2019)]|nr:extracellular solute-binding protein [Nostoc sp. B(2019)]